MEDNLFYFNSIPELPYLFEVSSTLSGSLPTRLTYTLEMIYNQALLAWDDHNHIVQSQKAVSRYFSSKQLLPVWLCKALPQHKVTLMTWRFKHIVQIRSMLAQRWAVV